MPRPLKFLEIKVRRDEGVALIIVLAFVVLLTGLIVAYFSRTMTDRQLSNSSFNQAAADALAKSALDILTSNLKQEVVNGSTALPDPNPNNYPLVYLPGSNACMAPVKNTPTNPISTLIRISGTNAIASPAVDYKASAALSTGTSANGKFITPARWNQHYLLPLATPATPTDTTPVSSGATAFTAPSWVYVTGAGGPADPPLTPATASGTSVIGRYAYAIYDEGALLDVNVAGCPTTSSTMAPQFATKGALAFADLTQLTTASGTTALITQTGVNNLVGWRNFASLSNAGAQPSGAFPAFTFSGTTAFAAYRNTILSNTNGFIKISGTATATGQTDQAFLSRQQLINLVKATGTSSFNPNALQYLGTFSRAVNAPSWKPTLTIGAMGCTIDYAGQAENTASVNRDIPNVRFTSTATITHYDDNGNSTGNSYDVRAGDPLIQRRFSLAKLAWLTYNGPKSGISDQAIKDCFGLKWNLSKWRWDYVAAKSAPGVAIKTLDQVASENREPNFFELLKAGILKGSLGRDPGPGISAHTGYGVYAKDYDQYKAEPNLQILQIGANIIDQFDADSYPTAIYLQVFQNLPAIDELVIQTVYGVENLPYLFGLCGISIADPVPAYTGDPTGAIKNWLQPELWNPHQVPTAPLSSIGGYPTGFRGYAYGRASGVWRLVTGGTYFMNSVTKYDDGTGLELSNLPGGGKPGELYFNDTGDATSPFYNTPRLLTLNLTTSAGGSIVDTTKTPLGCRYDSSKWSALLADNGNVNQFVGFATLGTSTGLTKYDVDPAGPVIYHWIFPDVVDLASFSLQYKGSDNNYHPYTFMGRIPQSTGKYLKPTGEGNGGHNPGDSIAGQTTLAGWGPIRVDPRTDRFSSATQWWDQAGTQSTLFPAKNTPVAPKGSGAGGAGDYGIPYLPGVFSYTPNFDPTGGPNATSGDVEFWIYNDKSYSTTKNAYYTDPDGVVRYGDCYRGYTATGSPPALASGDGGQLYHGDAAVTPGSTITNLPTSANTASNPPGSAQSRRPVILNRSFRSVAEFGFAFRDLPFKSLDFFSPTSADSALLDLFTTADQPATVAGQVNLNNAPAPVIRAIVTGGAKSDALGVQLSGTDAATLSAVIAADVATNGPYLSRSDLATRLGPIVSGTASSVAFNVSNATYSNWANKAYAEAPARALADVTNSRVWNLLIDVIAQTGTFTTTNVTDLNRNFTVQGERRYWLHVAIDRLTGKILDQQLEPVYE